ncbi:uncharacterized protein LOC117315345 [Pecten maximus]|uniref:uncharacterized protein LOC117315345 n=1 Tax=Pecten maximus TaxID=6579 RepID=UPI001458F44B|nr:uncharacterized protein LOC117315345 [Pecten maximus]
MILIAACKSITVTPGKLEDEFFPGRGTIAELIRFEYGWLQEFVDALLEAAGDAELFLELSIADILWGYEDALLKTVKGIAEKFNHTLPDEFGLFYNVPSITMPRGKFWRRGLAAKKGTGHPSNKGLTSDVDMGMPPVKKALVDDMGTPPVEKALDDDGLSVPFQKCFTSDVDMGTPPVKKALDDMGTPPVEKALDDMKGTPPKKALNTCLSTELKTELNTEMNSEMNTELNFELNTELNSELKTELKTELNSELNSELNLVLNTELNSEKNTELNSAINSELSSELNSDSNTDLKTNMKTVLSTDFNSAANTEVQLEANSTQPPITTKNLAKKTVQKLVNDAKLGLNVRNRNRKRNPLYNIVLVTGKYDRIKRNKIDKAAYIKQRTSSKGKKRIIKKPLYNIMLATAKSNRKKRNTEHISMEESQNEQSTEICTKTIKQAIKKGRTTNISRKCIQGQKLPANVRRISKNLVVVMEKNVQCSKKSHVVTERKMKSKSRVKPKTVSSKQKMENLEFSMNTQGSDEQVDPSIQKSLFDICTNVSPKVKHEKIKTTQPSNECTDKKMKLKSTSVPAHVGLSDEMRKKVEQRIAELSHQKHLQELYTERNVASKAHLDKVNTSKSNESRTNIGDMDIIFKKQTKPVIYPFQQLSYCTKFKLMSKLGIKADIASTLNYELRSLGKPLDTKSILGDGNCFFRALSFAVSDEESHHKLLRNAVVNHVMKLEDKFRSHLRPGFKSIPEYLSKSRMILDGTWATEVEILAAADLLRTNIYIYDAAVSSWQLFSAKQIDKNSKIEQEAIYLSHLHQTHYDVVLSVKAESAVETSQSNVPDTEKMNNFTSAFDVTKEKDLQISADTFIAKDKVKTVLSSNVEQSNKDLLIHKKVIQGHFHQGHPRFLENAGKQCVLNSLSALLHNSEKNVSQWTAVDLDHTLVKGDELYGYLRRSSTMNYDYLSIPDIPRLIEYNEQMFQIEFQESLSGTFGNVQDLDQYQFVTLFEALQLALDQQDIHGAFITFKGNTFVVVKQTGGYFVFDSHSRNIEGLQVPDGSSILKYSLSVQEVHDHCINLATSMNYAPQDMFEVTAVCIVHHQIEMNKVSQNAVINLQKGINLANEKESNVTSMIHEDEQVVKRPEKQGQIMLDKYFQYQTSMSNKKSEHNTKLLDPKSNRKHYMRNYIKNRRKGQEFRIIDKMYTLKSMTKARENKEFCDQEYKAQKAARQKPDMKMKTKQSTLKNKRKARENKEICDQEYKTQKTARQKPDMKMKTKQSTLKHMTKARENKEFCEQEYKAQKAARQQPDMKMKTKQSTLKHMTKARENKEFCDQEYTAQKAARQRPDMKMKTKQSTLKNKRKARENKEFCEQEYTAQKAARQQPDMKMKTKQSSLKNKRKARENKEFCKQEYKAQKAARQQPDMKMKSKQSTLKSMTKAREKKEYSEHEIEAKRIKRKHPLQLDSERLFKQESRKRCRIHERETERLAKGVKRTKIDFCEHEGDLSLKRHFGDSIEKCIEKFHEKAAEGPVFVCTCCHQTWFPKSVVKLSNTNISDKGKAYCTGYISQHNEEWLCRTCLATLKEEKIPRLSHKNGMKWPIKPDVLKLHPLEERLISQRIPFMQIRELPRGGQLSAKGNVVNVPVDIQPTVNALPRQIDEHVTIAVKLKKRLSHKSACFTENVRPNAVMNALEWLMENSEMYKNAGININTSWKEDVQSDQSEMISEYTGKTQLKDDREIETNNDNFCEATPDECIQGNADTLVDEADTDTNKVYVFAPGENQRPLSLYEDKDAEYLCFPSIFCGQKRKENSERQIPVHYSDIAKWELRSVDRRAAHSVPNIFFKLKKNPSKTSW